MLSYVLCKAIIQTRQKANCIASSHHIYPSAVFSPQSTHFSASFQKYSYACASTYSFKICINVTLTLHTILPLVRINIFVHTHTCNQVKSILISHFGLCLFYFEQRSISLDIYLLPILHVFCVLSSHNYAFFSYWTVCFSSQSYSLCMRTLALFVIQKIFFPIHFLICFLITWYFWTYRNFNFSVVCQVINVFLYDLDFVFCFICSLL